MEWRFRACAGVVVLATVGSAAIAPPVRAMAAPEPVRLALRPPPPDNFPIEGKVSAVDGERQTFKVGNRRVQVTPDTQIMLKKGFGSFRDIRVGRRVRVEGDGRRAVRVTILNGR